jgi:hypothetical protein
MPVRWAEESVRVAAEHCYRLPANHELGQAYLDANLPVVREQLLRAGVRLAGLLNAIFQRAQELPPQSRVPGASCRLESPGDAPPAGRSGVRLDPVGVGDAVEAGGVRRYRGP